MMREIENYKEYRGEGNEFGEIFSVTAATWREKPKQLPRLGGLLQETFPNKIWQHLEDSEFLLTANDVVIGESGRVYGHHVRVNFNESGEISLTPNYDKPIQIRSVDEAQQKTRTLINKLKDKSWLDLV